MDPGSVSLGMNRAHYTNAGIRENGTFSVNLPDEPLVMKTDHRGLVSGRKVDKGAPFKTFSGKLKTAPMIEECPVNMECRPERTVDFPSHDICGRPGPLVNGQAPGRRLVGREEVEITRCR